MWHANEISREVIVLIRKDSAWDMSASGPYLGLGITF